MNVIIRHVIFSYMVNRMHSDFSLSLFPVLQLFCSSPKPALRYAAVRTLNKVGITICMFSSKTLNTKHLDFSSSLAYMMYGLHICSTLFVLGFLVVAIYTVSSWRITILFWLLSMLCSSVILLNIESIHKFIKIK